MPNRPAIVLTIVAALLALTGWMVALSGPPAQAQTAVRVPLNLNANLTGNSMQMFGHCTLVQAYDLPTFQGCWALVALRDNPGQTVAVITSSQRLQDALQTALVTKNLMYFHGRKYTTPPLPTGGTASVTVFKPSEVCVYNNP